MWQLALPHARFVSSPLAAELDLLHPERGLVHWKRAGQSLADFAVLKPGLKIEASCDGCAAPIRATITFIAAQAEYTLLDSRPRVLVRAEFPALDGPTAPAISDLQVFRPVGIELSYVQIVGPADFGGAQLLGGATSSSETELQFARLEKGVIRCCRVRGWWVARSSDERIAVELAEEFRVAPLPLTA